MPTLDSPPPPVPIYAPIDPRIRRRRAEVRREEGRRRLRVVAGAVALSVLTVAVWLALHSPLLDIDRVVVTGAERSGAAAVAEAGGLGRGQPMVDLDEALAARGVETLPWVAEARVRRQWPGTVTVTVTERVPAAVASHDGGGWALVDGEGRVLETVADAPAGLVLLEGVAPAGGPGSMLAGADGALAVARAIGGGLRPAVVAVVAGSEGVDLRLRPAGVARLGPPDRLDEKLRAVETVLARVDTTDLAVLDVRLPSSPALTRAAPPRRVSTLSTG
jgi:cell division protein FtsQ